MPHKFWSSTFLPSRQGIALSILLYVLTLAFIHAFIFPVYSGETRNYLPISSDVTAQMGHANFCIRHPTECTANRRYNMSVKDTGAALLLLTETTVRANTNVKGVRDMEQYKKEEHWAYPGKSGDCEDYVLLKRKILIKAGWPRSALLIATVVTKNDTGHAVLVARTGKRDYILDNLSNKVLPWSEVPYVFEKVSTPKHDGKWVFVNDLRHFAPTVVASTQ